MGGWEPGGRGAVVIFGLGGGREREREKEREKEERLQDLVSESLAKRIGRFFMKRWERE